MVSNSLPKDLRFDEANKKLPSPYGLFREWAKKSLKGDWASLQVPGGFAVRVADQEDAHVIARKFAVKAGPPKETAVGPRTYVFGYQDGSYGTLAQELGYAVRLPGTRYTGISTRDPGDLCRS